MAIWSSKAAAGRGSLSWRHIHYTHILKGYFPQLPFVLSLESPGIPGVGVPWSAFFSLVLQSLHELSFSFLAHIVSQ